MDMLIAEQEHQSRLFLAQHIPDHSDKRPQTNHHFASALQNSGIMFFVERFPFFIFSNQSQIPSTISNFLAIRMKTYSTMTHEDLFRELSHMNNRLVSCLFCTKCCTKFHPTSCGDCRHKTTDVSTFISENKDKLVLANLTSDAQKIAIFKSHLVINLGFSADVDLPLTTVKDMVCLFCQKIVDSPVACSTCRVQLYSSESLYLANNGCQYFALAATRNRNQGLTKQILGSDKTEYFLDTISASLKHSYVLKPDNFTKMLLIYVRAKSRLPVFLMGETGCGKTSLIRFLCTFVLDDHFVLFSMHAGTSEHRILQKATEFVRVCQLFPDQDCWLVFDEFNTSPAHGLIKTIAIDRRLEGKSLPANAIIVGTCNPFKMKTKNMVEEETVGLKSEKIIQNAGYRKMYNVHPIPESIIAFCFRLWFTFF